MKKILLLFSFLSLCNSISFAQTVQDAIRFSNLNIGGTARTVGVGGAFGALGAEFGAITINPAGLGMYRSSEFVVTPAFLIAKTESQLNGSESPSISDTKNNFNINNVGVVFQNDGTKKKWISNSFAIGFNRVANFHQNFNYEGSTVGSFTDRYVEQAFGFDTNELSEFESLLAFQTGALYRLDENDNTTWISDYILDGGNELLFKRQSVERSGGMNEIMLAWGANLNHRWMFGASLGLPFFSFEETKIYEEEDVNDEIDFFNEFRIEERLETSGLGINLKLGLTYRLSQMFRFGLAVHSPTGMTLNDAFSTRIRYDFTLPDLNGAIEEDSPDGTFDYNLVTPWRAIVSGAAIIGRSGFITTDIEYVDYSFANFNFTGDSNDLTDFETEINTDIENQLTSAVNLRIGGEYAVKKYRLRAGFSNAASFLDQSDIQSLQSYSLGLGYRADYFFADFAYQLSSTENTYSPYRLIIPEDGQIVNNDRTNQRIMLTFGFKF